MDLDDGTVVYCDCLGAVRWDRFMDALQTHGYAPENTDLIDDPPEPGETINIFKLPRH